MLFYRDRATATLFGQVKVRLPRFRCIACGAIEVSRSSPIGGFFQCALIADQRVSRKGFHYGSISRSALTSIPADSRGAARAFSPAARP
jgi:hypothetical protein